MLQRERTERERAGKLVEDTAVSVGMALLFSLPYLQSNIDRFLKQENKFLLEMRPFSFWLPFYVKEAHLFQPQV